MELDRGKLKSYPGNYEDYIAMRAENEVIEQNNKKNKRHFINKNLHGCVQAQKQERQNNKLELTDLMIWSQKFNLIIKDKGQLNLAYSRLGKQVFELDHLTKKIQNKILFKDVTEIIQSGQRIGIVGPNGAGKTTMLNILNQDDTAYSEN